MNHINPHAAAYAQQGYSVYQTMEQRRKAGLLAKSNRTINPAQYGPAAIIELSQDAGAMLDYIEQKAS